MEAEAALEWLEGEWRFRAEVREREFVLDAWCGVNKLGGVSKELPSPVSLLYFCEIAREHARYYRARVEADVQRGEGG